MKPRRSIEPDGMGAAGSPHVSPDPRDGCSAVSRKTQRSKRWRCIQGLVLQDRGRPRGGRESSFRVCEGTHGLCQAMLGHDESFCAKSEFVGRVKLLELGEEHQE